MKIRIFLPIFNAVKSVERLIDEFADVALILKRRKHKMELLFINDGSTDGTHEVLNQAVAEFTWMNVKHNEKNLGNAGNIIAGYKWGADSDVAVVGCMDADGEHSPYAMIRHLKMIESGECDGVAGSIIFPDHHVDRRAIEKSMVEISNLPQNNEIVKRALLVIKQLSEEIIACDDHNDRNMMRFWGRMQSTIAGVNGTFYIQSPGYNLHQRHRVVEALRLFEKYQEFFTDNTTEMFPRWGLHGVMIYLIAVGTGAHIKATYLECFGKSPNRTPEKLLLQANAANIHTMMLDKFLPKKP